MVPHVVLLSYNGGSTKTASKPFPRKKEHLRPPLHTTFLPERDGPVVPSMGTLDSGANPALQEFPNERVVWPVPQTRLNRQTLETWVSLKREGCFDLWLEDVTKDSRGFPKEF